MALSGQRDGPPDRWAVAFEDVFRFLSPSSLSAARHPICRLAVSALHPKLPRRRGTPCRARARRYLRDGSQLGGKIRTDHRISTRWSFGSPVSGCISGGPSITKAKSSTHWFSASE